MQPALLITSESPMSATKDIEEIKACIYEETASFQRKDFDAWAECWSHSEDTVCIWQDPEMGLNVNDGWEAVSATTKSGMERYPKKLNTKFTHQSHKIILHGDFARVTFEQIAENLEGDALELVTHSLEIRTMVREPEGWKISFVSFYPLKGSMHRNNQVEVTPDGRVLWASEEAKALLTTHPALMISHGKLRARTLQSNKVLREAISRAEKLQDIFDLRQFMKDTGGDAVFPVVLGEDSEGSLQICFIHVLDGSIYVLIDDKARVGQQLRRAAMIFGLSDAQTRLVGLIAEGYCLPASAEEMDITQNTARTHLNRVFEKTGVNSQPALMRLMLSAGSPNF